MTRVFEFQVLIRTGGGGGLIGEAGIFLITYG